MTRYEAYSLNIQHIQRYISDALEIKIIPSKTFVVGVFQYWPPHSFDVRYSTSLRLHHLGHVNDPSEHSGIVASGVVTELLWKLITGLVTARWPLPLF